MRTTVARGIRVERDRMAEVERRMARKGWTFNRFVNYAISLALRSHQRADGKTMLQIVNERERSREKW